MSGLIGKTTRSTRTYWDTSFEKYVNQKQMGAYYTKEDITGYISRNTVIPFLFDAARKECPVAFGPDGGVWRLLRDDPDHYIYPAIGHGITWNAAADVEAPDERLDTPLWICPRTIAAGIDDDIQAQPAGTAQRLMPTACSPRRGARWWHADNATPKCAAKLAPRERCGRLTTSITSESQRRAVRQGRHRPE